MIYIMCKTNLIVFFIYPIYNIIIILILVIYKMEIIDFCCFLLLCMVQLDLNTKKIALFRIYDRYHYLVLQKPIRDCKNYSFYGLKNQIILQF